MKIRKHFLHVRRHCFVGFDRHIRFVDQKLEIDATRTQRSHHRAKQTLNARRIECCGKKWAAVSISKRIVVAVDFANANIVVFFFYYFCFVGLRCIDVSVWCDLHKRCFAFSANAMQPRTLSGKWAKRYWNGKAETRNANELTANLCKKQKIQTFRL